LSEVLWILINYIEFIRNNTRNDTWWRP